MGFSKSRVKKEVHSNTSLPQETRETSNKQPNFTHKQLEKEEIKHLGVRRRKEIIKIRAEINAKETKEITAKINKAKNCFFGKINKIDSSQKKEGKSNQ